MSRRDGHIQDIAVSSGAHVGRHAPATTEEPLPNRDTRDAKLVDALAAT